jgi:hypothetical protein
MIIQVLLSFGLSFIILFYLANSRRNSPTNMFALFGAGSGLIFVWNPQLANDVARFLGVGRGADLIFYCWVMISIALFLNIHLKFRQQSELLTDLIRKTAIAEARARKTSVRE